MSSRRRLARRSACGRRVPNFCSSTRARGAAEQIGGRCARPSVRQNGRAESERVRVASVVERPARVLRPPEINPGQAQGARRASRSAAASEASWMSRSSLLSTSSSTPSTPARHDGRISGRRSDARSPARSTASSSSTSWVRVTTSSFWCDARAVVEMCSDKTVGRTLVPRRRRRRAGGALGPDARARRRRRSTGWPQACNLGEKLAAAAAWLAGRRQRRDDPTSARWSRPSSTARPRR